MVAQMSKKSKIYHRPGCRFINRIEEDSLVTFDFEDGRIEDLQPCKAAHYHVQTDVARNQSPYKHLQYIVKHDAAKKVEQIDYKNLPKRTKKQKKYYRQAENRARRKSVSRVLDLFAEIEAKGELARVSFV